MQTDYRAADRRVTDSKMTDRTATDLRVTDPRGTGRRVTDSRVTDPPETTEVRDRAIIVSRTALSVRVAPACRAADRRAATDRAVSTVRDREQLPDADSAVEISVEMTVKMTAEGITGTTDADLRAAEHRVVLQPRHLQRIWKRGAMTTRDASARRKTISAPRRIISMKNRRR